MTSPLDCIVDTLKQLLPEHKIVIGYPNTDLKPPYAVVRPLLIRPDHVSIDGSALAWEDQYTIYCVGTSVKTSNQLSRDVVSLFQGNQEDLFLFQAESTLGTNLVESLYETPVLIQLNISSL